MAVYKYIEWNEDNSAQRERYEIYSDISGKELSQENLYKTDDGKICSEEELLADLQITELHTGVVACTDCHEQIDTSQWQCYTDGLGHNYCDNCLFELIQTHRYEFCTDDYEEN